VFATHQTSATDLKARVEAERAGAPFVIYYDGDQQQHVVTLDERPRLAIGRSPDAGICVGWDSQVSRVHAELERVGEHWVIADDGLSRNGTFLNETRITGRRRLTDRDVVRVGLTSIQFREPSAPTEASTVLGDEASVAASVTAAQRRVLVALCRPCAGSGDAYATPATNPQIAEELFLTVAAVKTHLRGLFRAFDIEHLPQQEKRHRLVAMAMGSGLVSDRDYAQS
jgi:pSer/pThr/pTyr-binding forkhead associated (FHA) protein